MKRFTLGTMVLVAACSSSGTATEKDASTGSTSSDAGMTRGSTSQSASGASSSRASASGSSRTSSSASNSTSSSGASSSSGALSSGSTSSASSSTGSSGACTGDCSDPSCTGVFACVDPVPGGWTGFVSLYDGPPASVPSCGGDFPTSSYVGKDAIVAVDASCSVCSCGTPTGQSCGFADPTHALLTSDAACNGPSSCTVGLEVPASWNGTCFGPDGAPGGVDTCGPNGGASCAAGNQPCNVSLNATALAVVGGSCQANVETPTVPPVAWGGAGAACGGPTPGTGCSAAGVCLPVPDAPFHAGICVFQTGDLSCPAGVFSEKHLFYGDASDSRTCTSCTCSTAQGGSCSATVTVYPTSALTSCTGAPVTLHPTSSAADCVNLAGNPTVGSREAAFTAVSGGACNSSGGTPAGAATGIDPTTFCCVP
jgi:hypothetical protein